MCTPRTSSRKILSKNKSATLKTSSGSLSSDTIGRTTMSGPRSSTVFWSTTTSILVTLQDWSSPHSLIDATEPCVVPSFCIMVEHLKDQLELVRPRRSRIFPRRWLDNVLCSIAQTVSTTRQWVSSSKDSPAAVPGVASMSSIELSLRCSLSLPNRYRQSSMPSTRDRTDSTSRMEKFRSSTHATASLQ